MASAFVGSNAESAGAPPVVDLESDGRAGELARFRVRALLVAVSWFEVDRRRAQLATLSSAETARLVEDSADTACAALLRRLDDYHDQSRFSVWAAKFAIHETAAAARRIAANAGKGTAARDTNASTPAIAAERGRL